MLNCRKVITVSMRYFDEAGSTSPATRLTAISAQPRATSPRLGLITAHTSGRLCHPLLRFSVLVHPRVVALVLGGVVEPRLREGEIRRHGVLRGRLGHE